MRAIGSGAPRAKTSRPSCGRANSASPARRICSSRLQPLGERVGKIGRFAAFGLGRRGQQQARLEIGEPGGHDEIVGRELEPQLARFLDEGEILLGERQHRNARQIDLLAARELEQEVERPLEAVEIDSEGGLAFGPVDLKLVKWNADAGHESPLWGGPRHWPAAAATARRGGARVHNLAPQRLDAAPHIIQKLTGVTNYV